MYKFLKTKEETKGKGQEEAFRMTWITKIKFNGNLMLAMGNLRMVKIRKYSSSTSRMKERIFDIRVGKINGYMIEIK